MTDETALLAAILAKPDEDMPRLAYADWLDEHGQHARAEFIRVQCELARIKEEANPKQGISIGKYGGWNYETPPAYLRFRELRHRERELWFRVCQAGLPEGLSGPVEPKHERGFISAITCSWDDWRDHNAAILKAHPIERVKLTTRPEIDWMMDNPAPINGEAGWLWALEHKWPRIKFELPLPSGTGGRVQIGDGPAIPIRGWRVRPGPIVPGRPVRS